MNCFRDGVFADLSTTPPVNDEVPGQAAFHIQQYIGNEDARSFESWLAVADFRISLDVPSEFDPLRLSL